MDIATVFILIITLFDEAFNLVDDDKFWGYFDTSAEPL
jgi:hypothetical protein